MISGIAQLWGPAFTESNTECLFAFWAYISNNLTLYPTMHHIELDIHTNLEKLDNIAIVEDTWNRCKKFRMAPNPNTFLKKSFPQVQSYNDVLTRVEIGLGRQRARFQIGFNLVYLLGIVLVIRSWFGCLIVILMVIERSRNGLLTCTVAVRMKMLILMVKKNNPFFCQMRPTALV